MPVPFTANCGQWPDNVLFRTSSGAATIWITREGLVYQFTRRVEREDSSAAAPWSAGFSGAAFSESTLVRGKFGHEPDSIEQLVVKATFTGANATPEALGLEELDYKCNYLFGNDPAQWRTDVPNYAAVMVRDVYPGIDVRYSGDGTGQVAYAFVVTPGADLGHIKVAYEGTDETSQATEGRAMVRTRWGQVIEAMDARVARAGRLSPRPISRSNADRGPALGQTVYPLEPMAVGLSYSTCLGGGSDEEGRDIALDASGNAFVTGYTLSSNFPTQSPYQTNRAGTDVFVTKLSSAGNSLIYSTYVGGSGEDMGTSIALDGSGNAYVTGYTDSTDFPTQNPYQTYQGSWDGFVTKLSAAGNSLIYSTYLGGSSYDAGFCIAVDGSGSAFVTGNTNSVNFPTQNPYQTYQGGSDAFVTKLSSAGNSLVYSTYFGGSNEDVAYGIALDVSGNACITGYTISFNLPIQNPLQSDQGSMDAFVTKLSSAGNSLIYSTYLGGSDVDMGFGIAVDRSGNAYVTGYTQSVNFPTQNPCQTDAGGRDAFVSKLSSAGNSLIYSTYLGGGSDDHGLGIALDGSGNAHVTGRTASSDFPTVSPFQSDQTLEDVFVTKLSGSGNSLVYSTYLGGGDYDGGLGIAVDGNSSPYVTGRTLSLNFPTQNPYQTDQGAEDAFVTKLAAPSTAGTLWFYAFSPVDLVVTDPVGDSIGIGFNTIGLGSSYDSTTDVNSPNLSGPDGQADDRVVIPRPYAGLYEVRIIPEPEASGSAKFTLGIRINGNQMMVPDDYREATVSSLGVTIPDTYIWTAATTLPGDVNADGLFTSSDVIYLVNYVFKGGESPVVPGHGDCNCDEVVNAADIIMLVNHVFKSGPPPCSQTAG